MSKKLQPLFAAISSVCFALLFTASVAASVSAPVFEDDDANAVDGAIAGDDWNQIYCDLIDPGRVGVCVGVAASSALVSVFLTDPVNGGVDGSSDDIFAGAKDSLDIEAGAPQDWQWKLGSANDKNDIEHAYAAIYLNGDGDYILTFGLDRLSNNGDADIGFWFLQNPVTKLGDGSSNAPCVPSGCPFSHGHEDGDVLVQADILKGGTEFRADVYTWGPNGLLNDPVAPAQGDLTKAIHGGLCSAGGLDACGNMNLSAEVAPWPYKFKFPGGVMPSAAFPELTFFEGAINLSKIFPNGIPCYSSFLAETRQSQSETAELEDLVLGKFDLCSISVSKSGPAKSKVTDGVDYVITITNDGALPLTKVSITDSITGDLTGQCPASLDPGASCVINVPYIVQAGDPDPLINVVDVAYSRGNDQVLGTATHSVNLFQPSITFDKKAEGQDGVLKVLQGATVHYTLKLNNTSSSDSPVLECTISDPVLSYTSALISIASGESTTINLSKSFPTAGTFTNTATVTCSPKGFPNVLTKSDSVTVKVRSANQVVMVEKTGSQYSKVGDTVNYTVKITNIGKIALNLTSIVDNILGDLQDAGNPYVTGSTCGATLSVGSMCTITMARVTQVGDPDPTVNTVTVTVSDQFGGSGSVSDTHSVDLLHPSYTVAKSCSSDQPVPIGQSANFQIDIVNTGDVGLVLAVSDPILGLNLSGVVLGVAPAGGCAETDFKPEEGVDDALDGCYRIEAGVTATGGPIQNAVDVTATLPAQYGLDNVLMQSAGAICEVQAGATRTWGFWKTHGSDGEDFSSPVEYGYTCHVFEDHLGGNVNIGWKSVTSCAQLFDLFWTSKAKEDGGAKRSQICQLQIQASRQLLGAILNSGLDNGAPVPIDPQTNLSIIDAMIAALAAENRQEIQRLMGLLAGYNESGDDVMIIDNDGAIIPHADPNGTRNEAGTTVDGYTDCN